MTGEEKMKEKLTDGVKTIKRLNCSHECKDRDQLSMDGLTPEILERLNPAFRILVDFLRTSKSDTGADKR